MIPSSLEFDDDVVPHDSVDDVQELVTVRTGCSDNRKLERHLQERLGDILTHQKHYLNLAFSKRRDWQILRAWKAIVGREQGYIMEQLIKYPLFYDYANYILGRSYKNFLAYLQTSELANGEVDEIARWQALQLTVVSSRAVEDEKEGNYIGYNVICEIKADETTIPTDPAEVRSRSWVACKRFREFRQLYLKLKGVHKNLSKLPFPGRTMMRSDTSEEVVSMRREMLHEYLQGVIRWIKQESPWVKGDTVSRAWIECTDALEEFLSLSEMAIKFPKQNINPTTDKDFALHPSVRGEDWFPMLQAKQETELFLSQTRMSLQGLSYIFENECALSLVDLIGVSSDPDEFIAFLHSLIGSSSVKKLFLGDVIIGDITKAVDCLVELIACPENEIELLLLAGWEMGDKLRDFSLSLSRSHHLRVLDLSHCGIENIQSGLVELCSVLRNTPLQELYLDENTFGDDGAKLLSVSLRQNPVLEVLSLKFCKITPFGIINLLDALDNSSIQGASDESIVSVNTNLIQLFIADMSTEGEENQIIRDLALQCSSMIENNQSLRELDLSGHYFDTESGKVIMRSLQQNKTLKKLNLSYSKRNWHSDQVLLEFFQANQSITSLHLRNHMPTPISDDDCNTDHLVYSIPNHEILEEFFAWNMREDEFVLLCKGFASNSSLRLLDLQAMQLTTVSAGNLNSMLSSNDTIEELLIRTSAEVDMHDLFSVFMKGNLNALTISNLTRKQGELFISTLEEHGGCDSFTRISISFVNGNIELDLWDSLDCFLAKHSQVGDSHSLLMGQ